MKLVEINEALRATPVSPLTCYFAGYYGMHTKGVFIAENGKQGADRLNAVFVAPDSDALGGVDEIANDLSIFRGAMEMSNTYATIPGPITEAEANAIVEKLFSADDFEAVAASLGIEFITL